MSIIAAHAQYATTVFLIQNFSLLSERNPSVTSSAQQVVLKPKESLSEWCRAYSQSEPEITWYLDDEQVHDGNGYTITSTLLSEGTQSTLKADNMNVKKSGEYKCVACNIGNCTSQVIRVYIDGEYWELVLIISFHLLALRLLTDIQDLYEEKLRYRVYCDILFG